MFDEQHEDSVAEHELDEAYNAVMMNDATARNGFDTAKSMGLSRELCMMAAVVALSHELQKYQEDMRVAAGECLVQVPEPRTDLGKLLSANIIIKDQLSAIRGKLVRAGRVDLDVDKDAGTIRRVK